MVDGRWRGGGLALVSAATQNPFKLIVDGERRAAERIHFEYLKLQLQGSVQRRISADLAHKRQAGIGLLSHDRVYGIGQGIRNLGGQRLSPALLFVNAQALVRRAQHPLGAIEQGGQGNRGDRQAPAWGVRWPGRLEGC